jgi:tetratricopeptide (TPR) repeat protein
MATESAELTEAKTLTVTAVKLYNEGKFKEALALAKRALELREKSLPANHELILDAAGNVAVIEFALKDFGQAESAYHRILKAQEEDLGPDSLTVADTLKLLAWLHYSAGKPGQAESEYKRALAIYEQKVGRVSNEVAQVLNRLIQIHELDEDLAKAEPIYKRLIEFDQQAFPEAEFLVNEALGNYACLLRKKRKTNEASELDARIKGIISTDPKSPLHDKDILNPRALSLPKPRYPLGAKSQHTSGVVVVRVTINEVGNVTHACAQNGPSVFWRTTEYSAYRARFRPATLNGRAVKVIGVITYSFIAQ